MCFPQGAFVQSHLWARDNNTDLECLEHPLLFLLAALSLSLLEGGCPAPQNIFVLWLCVRKRGAALRVLETEYLIRHEWRHGPGTQIPVP